MTTPERNRAAERPVCGPMDEYGSRMSSERPGDGERPGEEIRRAWEHADPELSDGDVEDTSQLEKPSWLKTRVTRVVDRLGAETRSRLVFGGLMASALGVGLWQVLLVDPLIDRSPGARACFLVLALVGATTAVYLPADSVFGRDRGFGRLVQLATTPDEYVVLLRAAGALIAIGAGVIGPVWLTASTTSPGTEHALTVYDAARVAAARQGRAPTEADVIREVEVRQGVPVPGTKIGEAVRITVVRPKIGFGRYDDRDNEACLELRPGNEARVSAGRCSPL